MPTIARAMQLSINENVKDATSFNKAVEQFKALQENEWSIIKISHVVADGPHCYVSCPDRSMLYFSPTTNSVYHEV